MAKQNTDPAPWNDDMADGCSGVVDFGFMTPCCRHDRLYYYGGDAEDKAFADDQFYLDMQDERYVPNSFWRWIARNGLARTRWFGIRALTYNYPPGHRMRRTQDRRVEAFNWAGPGVK